MKILVTGGTGYIGSHTAVELLNNDYEVVIIDNLSNSKREVVDKIKKITGKDVIFYEGDVCDKKLLEEIFNDNKIDAVIHFAGYKAVGESVKKPLMYYRNNIDSTLTLCEVMNEHNVQNIIKDILDNPKKYDYLDERLLNYTSDNNSIKKKILQLFKEQ